MTSWERWKRRPQTVWLRKALFQVHLWAGIGLGLYVLLMSVSGSALVFRRDLTRVLGREPRVAAGPGPRMSEEQVREIAERAYPGYKITLVSLRKNADQAALVWLESRDRRLQRLFDPYTGAELGDPVRPSFRFVLWLADLHDNLLLAKTGRVLNAAGGILTGLVALTGAVIWWPGVGTWRRSLSFGWKASPKGFNWTLHSALGFWTFVFVFMWALTGIYLSIPNLFNAAVDYLEPLQPASRTLRLGDQALFWMAQLHFGRFSGIGVKVVWTVLGLVPTALFVTGVLIWWKRVVKPWRVKHGVASARLPEAGAVRS